MPSDRTHRHRRDKSRHVSPQRVARVAFAPITPTHLQRCNGRSDTRYPRGHYSRTRGGRGPSQGPLLPSDLGDTDDDWNFLQAIRKPTVLSASRLVAKIMTPSLPSALAQRANGGDRKLRERENSSNKTFLHSFDMFTVNNDYVT